MRLLNGLRSRFRPRVLLGVLVLLGIAGVVAASVLRGGQAVPQRSYSLVTPSNQPLIAIVSAAGQIEPDRTVTLSMTASGHVSEVLVAVGDRVRAGQPLARVDDRELRLRLSQAAAALAQARASYTTLRAGATEADLAVAQAQLDQAQGQLLQAQGGVTEADLAAARAQVVQAQAALARLTGGPEQSDLDAAQARIRDAELGLQSQRDQLSAAKTSAQLALSEAASALTQAQARYAQAKYNWEYVQATGNDPIAPEVASGQVRVPNKVSDGQRESYYAQFVQAEAGLRTAESNVAQAQVAYDNALRAEATGVERAEGQLVVAQAQLAQLGAAPDADQLAAAQSQLAAARANLAKLGGDQRAGALQAARAAVTLAAARLAQLQDGPQSAELQAAEAQVDSAQAQYDLAQLALDQATLAAPFDGEIAEVNLRVGEIPSPARPALVLTDRSRLHVTVTVDEVDIARIAVSQPVTLTLDALPDAALAGLVESVAPLAQTQSAVASYQVRITIDRSDARVRPGMSTNADIVVAQRERALVVPRRAVRNDRGSLLVDITRDPGVCRLLREQYPERPALEQRVVQVGLSNEQSIEILSGLTLQDCIYVEGVETRLLPLSGPPPGAGRR